MVVGKNLGNSISIETSNEINLEVKIRILSVQTRSTVEIWLIFARDTCAIDESLGMEIKKCPARNLNKCNLGLPNVPRDLHHTDSLLIASLYVRIEMTSLRVVVIAQML